MIEQMSIFDFLGCVTDDNSTLGKLTNVNDKNYEDYLRRGEKILSLLREKKRREFIPSELLEIFSLKVYQAKTYRWQKVEYLESLAAKILKQKWCDACRSDDFSSFFKLLGLDAKVTKLPEDDVGWKILYALLKKKNYEGGVKITIGDTTLYAPIGDISLGKKSGSAYRLRYGPKMYCKVCTAYDYFKRHFLCISLKERVMSELNLPEKELADNRVAIYLRRWIEDILKKFTNDYGFIKVRKDVLDIPYVIDFFKTYNYGYCVEKDGLLPAELFALYFSSNMQYPHYIILYMNVNTEFLSELFDILYDIYTEDKQTVEFERRLATDYAKVYQTKKTIPNKVVKAMSESGFNDYFGYVEFDEMCDLEKVEEINKEFKALQNSIFNEGKREDVSIRFRKLGHHKANGLYFPALKCLCVDIRSPSSLVHEYGHCLDYEYGNLSRGVRFTPIKLRYKKLLENYVDSLPENDLIRRKLLSNTKYNLSYYLESTEIFARALEIYLVRCRKVDNSLVKPDGGFAYPEDEELTEAIKNYFDNFFGSENYVKKAAAN